MVWRHNRQELGLYWGVPVFPVWSDTDQQWTLSTQEHRGRLADMYLCGNGCYNKIHKLSHICLADVDPEENVQIMDQELINETCLRASYSETCFFFHLFCKWKLHYKPGQKPSITKNVMDRKKSCSTANWRIIFFLRNGKCKTLSALLSLRVADQWHSKCHLAAWKLF